MENEIWMSLKGYDGYYEISNIGRIKSLHKRQRHSDILFGRIGLGYERVHLSKNSVATEHFVHRLVAVTFIPNPDNKPYVNHKNGVKADNRVSNLEWATASENTQHAVKTGLLKGPIGEVNGGSILTNEQAKEIYNSNCPREELSDKYGVTPWVISAIRRGERWHRVTGAKKYVPCKKKLPLSEQVVIEIFTSTLTTKAESANRNINLAMIQGIRAGRKYLVYTSKIKEQKNAEAQAPITT